MGNVNYILYIVNIYANINIHCSITTISDNSQKDFSIRRVRKLVKKSLSARGKTKNPEQQELTSPFTEEVEHIRKYAYKESIQHNYENARDALDYLNEVILRALNISCKPRESMFLEYNSIAETYSMLISESAKSGNRGFLNSCVQKVLISVRTTIGLDPNMFGVLLDCITTSYNETTDQQILNTFVASCRKKQLLFRALENLPDSEKNAYLVQLMRVFIEMSCIASTMVMTPDGANSIIGICSELDSIRYATESASHDLSYCNHVSLGVASLIRAFMLMLSTNVRLRHIAMAVLHANTLNEHNIQAIIQGNQYMIDNYETLLPPGRLLCWKQYEEPQGIHIFVFKEILIQVINKCRTSKQLDDVDEILSRLISHLSLPDIPDFRELINSLQPHLYNGLDNIHSEKLVSMLRSYLSE